MSISLILSKCKSLAPVAVVASAVAITVKLLTTQTPTHQEELKVSAEEDINLVDFKDDIVIPPPPEEEKPPKEEKEMEEEQEEDTEDEEKEKSDEEGGGEDERKQEEEVEEKKEEKKEEKQSKPRRWNESNPFSKMLSRLLSKDKKK